MEIRDEVYDCNRMIVFGKTINYFRIGMMKMFMQEFGAWLRHKIRVIVIKQWKTPKTIYRNLCYLNQKNKNGFDHEAIYKVANSRLGWYRRGGMDVANFILSPDLLENKGRSWSAQSFKILSKISWNISCRAVYETRTYGSTRGR
ncbi:MAG: hypothetical protein PHS74_13685 [Lachnospiraceae bacterium]|nr:hypothetical protein [Lachnospiraceae bacterium]